MWIEEEGDKPLRNSSFLLPRLRGIGRCPTRTHISKVTSNRPKMQLTSSRTMCDFRILRNEPSNRARRNSNSFRSKWKFPTSLRTTWKWGLIFEEKKCSSCFPFFSPAIYERFRTFVLSPRGFAMSHHGQPRDKLLQRDLHKSEQLEDVPDVYQRANQEAQVTAVRT